MLTCEHFECAGWLSVAVWHESAFQCD